MNRSPERNEFRLERYRKKLAEDPNDEDAKAMIKLHTDFDIQEEELEKDLEWQKDNLEYDLLTTDWIIEKAKSDKVYAQHLYAAMCNNDFMRNDVWPILTEKKWSCSWRHAGGIIADMREEGGYIDWYCSGIVDLDMDHFEIASEEQKKKLLESKAHVSESVVTEEIRKDLLKLGWIVVEDKSSD